jgi:hypothetical protein
LEKTLAVEHQLKTDLSQQSEQHTQLLSAVAVQEQSMPAWVRTEPTAYSAQSHLRAVAVVQQM